VINYWFIYAEANYIIIIVIFNAEFYATYLPTQYLHNSARYIIPERLLRWSLKGDLKVYETPIRGLDKTVLITSMWLRRQQSHKIRPFPLLAALGNSGPHWLKRGWVNLKKINVRLHELNISLWAVKLEQGGTEWWRYVCTYPGEYRDTGPVESWKDFYNRILNRGISVFIPKRRH